MIPKIIHYCWFGNNKKNKLVEECIASWKKFLPDYEIIEWNDNNLKNCLNQYVNEAYIAKKWAFVSDYFRLYALYNYGGIYFDSDNEVFKSFDKFLNLKFFTGYEKYHETVSPFTAVVGAESHNHIIADLLKEYENLKFYNNDGSLNMYTNTARVSDYFAKKYKIFPPYDGTKTIELEKDCILYPYSTFCNYKPGTSYAIHHFSGSWLEKKKLSFWQKIFSITNSEDKKYKIIRILGIKIKVKRKC